ncbi:MAG: 16S rRNA (cytosine(1402)-N(4))-methyltransferase RsmH, partial [Acidimicrobiia bacterium]
MTQDREYHRPVMADETVELLGPVPPGVVVDATFGGGGHSRRLLEVLSSDHRVLAIDRDPEAVARASNEGGRLQVVRGNFANLARILEEANVTAPVGVLVDFGVSSHHLDDPARGFSYRHGGPLDMRMDPDQDLTASDLVNGLDVAELSALIKELGEEPMASRIAGAIVRARPISDTARLAEVIASAVPPSRTRETGRRRLHPARRTFQALRIAVNSELEAVGQGVDQAL